MFNIGDVVRLNRGWTPMIVLNVEADGEVWAVYASRNQFYPIEPWHYDEWRHAYSYHRPTDGFTHWDGDPINLNWNYIMPNRYKSLKQPHISGTFLNTSSSGQIIIETDRGDIVVLDAQDAARDIPYTFQAKATNNSYTCHYTLPDGASVQKGDLLISESGNTYVVKAVNTENINPKGVFKGHRVVKEAL